MFDWITKPFIEWNMIDRTFCYLEIGIVIILITAIAMFIVYLKDKFRNKRRRLNRYVKDKR